MPAYGELPSTFWEQHHVVIILGSIVFLIFTLLLLSLFLLFRGNRATVSPETVARQALEKLQGRVEDGKVLSEISQILRHYIGAVLGFSSTEMTTTECCAALSANPRISAEPAQMMAGFLRECDSRKFSPTPSATPFNGTHRALMLVELAGKRLQESHLPSLSPEPPPYIRTKPTPPSVPAANSTAEQRIL